MLSDIFEKLQTKTYVDSRDIPVQLTEEHEISGSITDANRKIKLGEKVHSFQNLIVYKVFKSSTSLDIKLADYDNLAIFYSQIDLTVEYNNYDSTYDVYSMKISLIRNDTNENQSTNYDITGNFGSNNILTFTTIQGNFSILATNFILNAKAIISIIGYENSIMIIDSFNPFVSGGSTNHIYFNVPGNAIYINELPLPQSSGDIYILVRYLGLGSVITAESLNDIISIVKYYNLLPKFEIEKNNNNDIKLYILGEYYYLDSYIERIDDLTYQLEDTILLGQQNAIISFLDIANHAFNIRRVSVGDTYNNVISDITSFIVENPETEMPMFILIFDTNKNLFEQAYVNRNGFSISGTSGSTLYKYNISFTNALNVSFTMSVDKKPVISIYDSDGNLIEADSINVSGSLVEIIFVENQTGSVACVN